MKKRLLFSLLLFSVVAVAQTVPVLPPDQDAAITSSIHFFQDLRTEMETVLNTSTLHIQLVGWFIWGFLSVKNLLYTIGRTAAGAINDHHSSIRVAALFLCFLRISIAATILAGYLVPMHAGVSFSKLIPGIAHFLSSTVQLDAVKTVMTQINAVLHMPTPNPLNFLMIYEYAMLIGVMAAAELAMTGITSVSFLFMGALTFTGPLWIPFFIDLDPKWHSLFWSWIGDQIVYSMYQVFSDVFVAVFAGMYLGFFCRIMGNCHSPTPSFQPGDFLGESAYLLLITITFVYVMFQIPSFTSRRFSGFGSLGQDFSNTLQRAALSLAFGL